MSQSRSGGITSSVARKGVIAAGILAALMACFLIAGILLPGTVEVTRFIDIEAPPAVIFPLLDAPSAWDSWTPWGEVESRLEGPAAGTGARRVWDDAQMGSGSLTIVAATSPSSVAYLVEVEDGAIRFEGSFAIEGRGGSSRVTWSERMDLGWNPLLGWTALGMEESQGLQLEESLARLKEQAEPRR